MDASMKQKFSNELQSWPPNKCVPILSKALKELIAKNASHDNDESSAQISQITSEIMKHLRILHKISSYQHQVEELSKMSLLRDFILLLNLKKDVASANMLCSEIFEFLLVVLFEINRKEDLVMKILKLSSEQLKEVLNPVKSILTENLESESEAAILNFCKILLTSILSYQGDKNSEVHFKLFSNLCDVCGLDVDFNEIPDTTLKMITSMLEVSSESNNPLSKIVLSQGLKTWLSKLMKWLLSNPNEKHLPSSWYNCIVAILKIDPVVVMSKVSSILMSFIQIKSKGTEWNDDLDMLMAELVKVFVDSREIPKFTSAIIASIKSESKQSKSESKSATSTKSTLKLSTFQTGSILFHSEFFKRIELTYLPAGQLIIIWKELLETLIFFKKKIDSGDCSVATESAIATTYYFFEYLLSSVKFADNTLPSSLLPELQHLMQRTYSEAIHSMIQILMKISNSILMSPVLSFMHCIGELEMLLHAYCFRYKSIIDYEKCNKDDLYDLSLVHPYIPHDEMKKMLLYIIDLHNFSSFYQLLMLFMQRLRCAYLFTNQCGVNDSLITKLVDFIFQNVKTEKPKEIPDASEDYDRFGTYAAELILKNIKICYRYLKSTQLKIIFLKVISSKNFCGLNDIFKCTDSVSQGLEFCVVSAVIDSLRDTISRRKLRESDDKTAFFENLILIFDSSSVDTVGDNRHDDAKPEIVKKKFSALHNLLNNPFEYVTLCESYLHKLIKLIMSLPLEFLTWSSLADLYLATLFFCMVLRKTKESNSGLRKDSLSLLQVIANCCKTQPLIIQCFDSNKLMELLVNGVIDQSEQINFKGLIVDHLYMIMKDKDQYAALEEFVLANCESNQEELGMILMEAFYKGIEESVGSTRLSRLYFWKLAGNVVTDKVKTVKQIKAYTFMIQVSNSKDKFIGKIDIPDWKSRIAKCIKLSFKSLESDANLSVIKDIIHFFTVLWRNRSSVMDDEDLEKKTMHKTINALLQFINVSEFRSLTSSCIQKMFENCSDEAFTFSIDSLFKETVGNHDVKNTNSFLKLWNCITLSCQSEAQIHILNPFIQRILWKVLSVFNDFTQELNDERVNSFILGLNLLISCAANEKINCGSSTQMFLLGCQLVPVKDLHLTRKYEELFTVISLQCDLLNQLLMKHSMQVLQASSVFISIINQLIDIIVTCADQDEVVLNRYEESLTMTSNSMKRLIVQFSSHKKHVDKVLYAILSQYVSSSCKVTILPSIKNVLQQGIFACFASADIHTIDHLRVALSASSREVFKVLHENYTHHHKYTGKV